MKFDKYCLVCHKKISNNCLFKSNTICKTCFEKLKIIYKKIYIENIECLIIYEYNSVIQKIIFELKGLGDIEIGKVFFSFTKSYLKNVYKNSILLPIPSSQKSNQKRGFNHVVEVFKNLEMPMLFCFSKTNNVKQSSQSQFNRINIKNSIKLDDKKLNAKKNYVIVDDITTTHSSIRTCIKLLKEAGINKIRCLVLASKKESILKT